jgi:hypothetical protein
MWIIACLVDQAHHSIDTCLRTVEDQSPAQTQWQQPSGSTLCGRCFLLCKPDGRDLKSKKWRPHVWLLTCRSHRFELKIGAKLLEVYEPNWAPDGGNICYWLWILHLSLVLKTLNRRCLSREKVRHERNGSRNAEAILRLKPGCIGAEPRRSGCHGSIGNCAIYSAEEERHHSHQPPSQKPLLSVSHGTFIEQLSEKNKHDYNCSKKRTYSLNDPGYWQVDVPVATKHENQYTR